jgi:predicted nucleic acid-binding protein
VIVLDTSVISELTRQVPEPGVLSWLGSLPAGEVGTTAVTAAELLYGVARMPAGRRKAELAAAVGGPSAALPKRRWRPAIPMTSPEPGSN